MPVSSFGIALVTAFISSSLVLPVPASQPSYPPCYWETLRRSHDLTESRLGEAFSEELYTLPLPATHIFVGYYRSHGRFRYRLSKAVEQ